jgi:energy-coupling factor transporter ATP-binding protein EcfA2
MTQNEALEILKTGKNVFLTGAAGSGKTYLLNKYVAFLKDQKIEVAITASTGLAATHLNGRTIHSWCGMGINTSLSAEQIGNIRENDDVAYRIMSAGVLIIDEISMLNASRLDLVNNICQAVRQDLRPFGGLQVILSGDFFQLPPVTKLKTDDGLFVVDSDIWPDLNLAICYLEEQYRQEDQNFLKVLAAIRANAATEKIEEILQTRLNQPLNLPLPATKLYTHNRNVDAENLLELAKLAGDERVYQMAASGVPSLVKSLKESYCLAPETLKLKIDAVVMFVRNNFGKGYVNGTLGRVTGFDADSGYPLVQTLAGREIIASPETWAIEEGNRTIASVSQVPLRLAWAITVHKSQGMSLDCAEIDLSRAFEFGMGYVALSRLRTLEGLKLLGINAKALLVKEQAMSLDKKFIKQSRQDLVSHKKLGAAAIKRAQKDFLKKNEKNRAGSGKMW